MLLFLIGVIDSEDIPLNLSREMLQNSSILRYGQIKHWINFSVNSKYKFFYYTFRKLNQLLTSKIVKFLYDKSIKDLDEYMKFYQDYGVFIKEGVVTNEDPNERVCILLF